jgi:hypothetical protein
MGGVGICHCRQCGDYRWNSVGHFLPLDPIKDDGKWRGEAGQFANFCLRFGTLIQDCWATMVNEHEMRMFRNPFPEGNSAQTTLREMDTIVVCLEARDGDEVYHGS